MPSFTSLELIKNGGNGAVQIADNRRGNRPVAIHFRPGRYQSWINLPSGFHSAMPAGKQPVQARAADEHDHVRFFHDGRTAGKRAFADDRPARALAMDTWGRKAGLLSRQAVFILSSIWACRPRPSAKQYISGLPFGAGQKPRTASCQRIPARESLPGTGQQA